jgi:hypothetical protein
MRFLNLVSQTGARQRTRWRSCGLAPLLVLIVLSVSAACASAETLSPWWHLTTDVAPTVLKAGLGTDEVQELKVVASAGEVLVEGPHESHAAFPWDASADVVQGKLEGLFGTGNVTVAGGPAVTGTGNLSATSTEVTAVTGAFEKGQEISGAGVHTGTKIEAVGAGKLTLSQAAETTGTGIALAVLAPYRVTFVKGLSEHGQARLIREPSVSREACDQTPSLGECLTGEASAIVATEAVADGVIGFQAINLGDASTGSECIRVPAGTGRYTEAACSEEADGGLERTGEYDAGGAVLRDRVPAGMSLVGVELEGFEFGPNNLAPNFCAATTSGEAICEYPIPVRPYELVEERVKVAVGGARSGAVNSGEVTGGQLASRSLARPVTIGSGAAQFGVEEFSQVPEEVGGGVDARAGSHPFQLTTSLVLNEGGDLRHPPDLPRTLRFNLPAGLVGNATALPRCDDVEFRNLTAGGAANQCAPSTAVGAVSFSVDEPANKGLASETVPLFNLTPLHGEPARFGFEFIGIPVTIDTSLRTGRDYGVTASVNNITELANFISDTVTFWGVPGDPAHDEQRGWGCLVDGFWAAALNEPCEHPSQANPLPFLTMPTSCKGAFAPSVEGVAWPTWEDPQGASFPAVSSALTDSFGDPVPLTGCNQLAFSPFVEAAPDVQDASSPSGLSVKVRVPQEVSENAKGTAGSSVKNITLAFPAGVTLNPSGAGGLEACSEGQVGFEADIGQNGFEELNPETEPGSKTPLFSATLPEPLSPGLNLGALGFCASASKIGTVKIKSPLIANPVEGSLYLATQNQNPFGSLLAAYIVAEDPVSGTIVKLPGRIVLCKSPGEAIAGESCQAPGQVVSTFEDEPQLPFEEAEIHLFGGERAPLSTPAHCGSYTTNAVFTPWSGNEPVRAQSQFNITSGPNGSSCPSAQLPFSTSLTGGTTNINAGGFSPLTTTIGRADGSQDMQSVTLHMPAGLEGILKGVKLCPEAQANEGTCGPESLIGETTVEAGVGQQPVSVKGGKVFLTEKYAGAPFGLSIVNPVKTGPFDLEHDTSPQDPGYDPPCDCVVVRAKIEVNPTTAELTIRTDESGPHAIPHLIDGVPVQIKAVNVTINREHFTFNPTNCNRMSLTGSIASDEGASSPVSVPFQSTNCEELEFEPKVSVSALGHASRRYGQSLDFKISYPSGSLGTDANVAEAKFDIPKQFPAELNAIQQACIAHTFETDRAACPVHSIIGHAVVHTQVLPVPLEGPVYFVSNAALKFPNAVLVLSGYGLNIELTGETFIDNKTGVTSATFANTPDVPFESIEVSIPTGEYSEFGSNLPHESYNFCGQKLKMPTLFKASNGREIREQTPVAITGCAKALTNAQKLAAALKVCHKDKNKVRREVCERVARKKYSANASRTRRK